LAESPGGSKTYDLTVRAPKSSLTRTDVIQADMSGQGTLTANSPEMTLHIEGKAHPLFAYSYQTIDDVVGNRDGQVQRGERVRTLVKVKNIGQGTALRTEASCATVRAGRDFDQRRSLEPGSGARSQPHLHLRLRGRVGFSRDEYQLDLVVADTFSGIGERQIGQAGAGWPRPCA